MAPIGSIKPPYRAIHIGYPGSGKTGALACLANAGWKLRGLDYDGNIGSLVPYLSEEAMQPGHVDVLTLMDRMRNNAQDGRVEAMGVPTAFNEGLEMLIQWKYKMPDGTEVDLGKSDDWGQDTIVFVDTITTWGKAAKLRAMKMANKNAGNMTSAVWGMAVADVINAINIMKRKNFHLIINAHKQVLGPQDFMTQNDDKADNEAIKEAKLEQIKDGMIPHRYYPVGVTKNNSTTIHGELPIMLEFKKEKVMGKDVRIIDTVGSSIIDVKIPGKNIKKTYGIETGLLEIFEALGYKAPGFK